ncbi:SDR family oxidoreductase [Actinoallomurus liliacearum]|uniref:SDR family oxidoreductase n=1 Tax=Actinoallomurus liliacearum TaxID=1080073 RepID=A0ABP8TTT5_9ACTN
MRIVVTGATGNVGTSVVEALGGDPGVDSVLGLARREPDWTAPKTEWAAADVVTADLAPLFRGADAVIHLAWAFHPTHDSAATWRTNVIGSTRVFDAVAAAGVPALVYASSVGAYSPGPKDRAVDESWPTHGWPGASYTREKAYVERVLDAFEAAHPDRRVVRLRPGFIFKREAAQEQRRIFGGPLVPNLRAGLLPVVPDIPGLRFQTLHTTDAAEAYRLAALGDARGPFNVAADPVVGAAELADLLGARRVRVPAALVRGAVWAGWQLNLVPASPGLFDAVLRIPIMDTGRARRDLGWSPRYSSLDALREFLEGLRTGAGLPTPPLTPHPPGGRLRELLTSRR